MCQTLYSEKAHVKDRKAMSVRDFESLEKKQLCFVLHREYQVHFESEVEFKLG